MQGRLDTSPLLWGEAGAVEALDHGQGGWDVICAADCIYPGRRDGCGEGAMGGDRALLATLQAACALRWPAASGRNRRLGGSGDGGEGEVGQGAAPTQVLLGYKTRSAEQLAFFTLAARRGFVIEWAAQQDIHADFRKVGVADDPRQTQVLGGVHICTMHLPAPSGSRGTQS